MLSLKKNNFTMKTNEIICTTITLNICNGFALKYNLYLFPVGGKTLRKNSENFLSKANMQFLFILKIGITYLYFLYLNENYEICILVQNAKKASHREVSIFQSSAAFAFSNLALASGYV